MWGHIVLETAQKVEGPQGYCHWKCNLAAMWTMSVMGVPVMTKKSFIQAERDIGEWWRQQFQEAMAAAGKEEKRLAEERGDYHEHGVQSKRVVRRQTGVRHYGYQADNVSEGRGERFRDGEHWCNTGTVNHTPGDLQVLPCALGESFW